MPKNESKPARSASPGKISATDGAGVIVGAILILLIFVYQWTQSVKTEPVATIPPLKTPSPNAYDFYFKAQEGMGKASEIDTAFWQLRRPKAGGANPPMVHAEKVLAQNGRSLGLISQGMQYDFLEPPPDRYLSTTSVRLPLNTMIELIRLDAFVKSSKQDWQGAVSAELDRLQFLKSIQNYDLSSAATIGANGGGFQIYLTQDPIDHLTAAQCKEDIARLQNIMANQRPLEELLEANKWRTLVKMDAVGNELNQINLEAGEMRKTWFGEFGYQDMMSIKSQNRRESLQSYLREMDGSIASIKQNKVGGAMGGAFRHVGIEALFFIDPQNIVQNRMNSQSEDVNLLLKLALQAYKLKHGSNPPTLKTLVPEYLSELPADPSFPAMKVQDRQFRYLFTPSSKTPAR